MVVLKKIKSATLVEVIVASILVIIIFVIASLVLNNLVLNTFSKDMHPIENRLNELEYKLQSGLIKLPYKENYKDWDIVIGAEKSEATEKLLLSATNKKSNKVITRIENYDKP